MSVRGNFYYKNVIPKNSDFTLIYNLKAPLQAAMGRILLIDVNSTLVYPLTPPYIAFKSNGSTLTITVDDTYGNYDSISNYSRLEYIVLEFNSVENKLYFWNVETLTKAGVPYTPWWNSVFSDNVLHMYFGLATGPDLEGAQYPDINNFTIVDRTLTSDDVKSIVAGVHPLENLNILKNILFFREYPHKSHTEYFTSIGEGFTYNGSLGSLNYGFKQLSSHNALYNPDRGYKFKLQQDINLHESLWYIYNNTIGLHTTIIIDENMQQPVERTFFLADSYVISDTWGLVDKYIVANNNLTFNHSSYLGFERTFNTENLIKLGVGIKTWDGKISNELTFQTTVTSSLRVLDITSDVVIDYSEAGHNIKLDYWADSCFAINDLVLAEYEEYDVDQSGEGFQIVEEITVSKNLSRPVDNQITFHSVINIYVVKQESLENYS